MTPSSQVDLLGERMDKGFSELKEMLIRYEERLRGVETREVGSFAVVGSRLDAAWKKIDDHSEELKILSDSLSGIGKSAALLETVSKWLLGVMTAIVVAVVIAFVTGRIDFVVR